MKIAQRLAVLGENGILKNAEFKFNQVPQLTNLAHDSQTFWFRIGIKNVFNKEIGLRMRLKTCLQT